MVRSSSPAQVVAGLIAFLSVLIGSSIAGAPPGTWGTTPPVAEERDWADGVLSVAREGVDHPARSEEGEFVPSISDAEYERRLALIRPDRRDHVTRELVAATPDAFLSHPDLGDVDLAYEGDGFELIQYRSADVKVFLNRDGAFTNIIRAGKRANSLDDGGRWASGGGGFRTSCVRSASRSHWDWDYPTYYLTTDCSPSGPITSVRAQWDGLWGCPEYYYPIFGRNGIVYIVDCNDGTYGEWNGLDSNQTWAYGVWDNDGIPDQVSYTITITVNYTGAPPPPDFNVTAPYTSPTRTTCGAGNDCEVLPSEEHVYEVTLPLTECWVFSLCGSSFDTFLLVGTTACGYEVGFNDDACGPQSELTAYLSAGTYYVTIEGSDSGDCGDYVLSIEVCDPTIRRVPTSLVFDCTGPSRTSPAPAPGAPDVAGGGEPESTGKAPVRIVIDGRPPDVYRAPAVQVPEPNPARGINVLSDVPCFDWSYGCAPTAGAMMMGYYDRHGYPHMYAGTANGGVCPLRNDCNPIGCSGHCSLSAAEGGLDGRTARGHVDDYWIGFGNCDPDPWMTNGWAEHNHEDCTADFMGTSQSAFGNCDGGTSFWAYTDGSPMHDPDPGPGLRDGCRGLRLFAESRGYTVLDSFNQFIQGHGSDPLLGFTFQDFQDEIDAGRPVIIHAGDHSMLGCAYNTTGSVVYLHDTWDWDEHEMTWGGEYNGAQHFGVTVLQLTPSPLPDCFAVYNEGGGVLEVDPVDTPSWVTLSPTPPYSIAGGGSLDVCVEVDCGECGGSDLDGVITLHHNDPHHLPVEEAVHVYCPSGCPCLYDLDGNCTIAGGDFGLFAGCWLSTQTGPGEPCELMDFDCNGTVAGGDFGLFAGVWLSECHQLDATAYASCWVCTDGPVICPWVPTRGLPGQPDDPVVTFGLSKR